MQKRIQSFKYAFHGIYLFIKDEMHAKIHVCIALLVIVLGFIVKINFVEWIVLLLLIGFVITAEVINSAIENLADFVSPQKHQLIKKVKDLAAGAVLVSVIIALIIGIIIFAPKILQLWHQINF